MSIHERFRDPQHVSELFPGEGAHDRSQLFAGTGGRSVPALHQCRDGAVQVRVSGHGKASLFPGHFFPEVRPRRREAQRSGERRQNGPASHLFRDARELLLRRLFQAGRDRVRMGAARPQDGARPGQALGHRAQERRRGLRHLAGRDRASARAHHPSRRQGQLLGHGRHRALRPVLRDHLRPGSGSRLRETGVQDWGVRMRPVSGDMEPRVHAVQS